MQAPLNPTNLCRAGETKNLQASWLYIYVHIFIYIYMYYIYILYVCVYIYMQNAELKILFCAARRLNCKYNIKALDKIDTTSGQQICYIKNEVLQEKSN